jgi:hypothetical protein
VVVLGDNNGSLYGTPLSTFVSTNVTANSLWGGTKNGTIWNGDAGVGNVGIGTTAPVQKFVVNDVNTVTNSWGNVFIGTTDTQAIDKGGSLTLGGVYTGTTMVPFAGIAGRKTDGTDATTNGYLALSTLRSGSITEAMRITNTGKVGIGTTNPTSKLYVAGSAYFQGADQTFIVDAVGGGDKNMWIGDYATPANTAGIYLRSTTNSYIRTAGGSLNLFPAASGTTGMTILTGGNVGIGTTDPTTKLEVGGVNYIKSYAATVSSLGASGNVVVMADNNGSLFSTSTTSFISNNSLDLWKGTKNGTIWNGDAGLGNVGIGTTNPITKLNLASGSTSKVEQLLGSNSVAAGAVIASISAAYQASNFVTYPTHRTASIDFLNGPITYSVGGQIVFNTGSLSDNTTNAPVEAMRIQNGNVGIGMTNPTYNLEVNGSAKFSNIFMNYGQIFSAALNSSGGGGQNTGYLSPDIFAYADKIYTVGATNVTNSSYLFDLNASLAIINRAVGDGVITIDYGSSRYYDTGLTINFDRHGNYSYAQNVHVEYSSDNVVWTDWVNTTTNADRTLYQSGFLPLHRYLRVTLGNPNDGARDIGIESLSLYNDTYAFTYNGTLSQSGGTLYGGINFSGVTNDITSVSGQHIAIMPGGTGNVGIGLTNPATKLDLSGGANYLKTYGATVTNLGSAGTVVVLGDNNGSLYGTPLSTFVSTNVTANSLWGGTKNGAIWNGDAGLGNVGIGTTNPAYKLDVSGVINAGSSVFSDYTGESGYRLKVRDYGGTANDAGIGIEADLGKMWFNNVAGGGYYFSDGTNGPKLTILGTSGNVGIGTTNPATKLQVVGGDIQMDNGKGLYFFTAGSGTAATNNGITGSDSTDVLTFRTAGQDRMTIKTGNVGIGTTNPLAQLNVADSSATAGVKTVLIINNQKTAAIGDGARLEFRHNNDAQPTSQIFSQMLNAGDLTSSLNFGSRWWNGTNYTNTDMTLSFGNVGIGLTNPATKLDLSGGSNYLKTYGVTATNLGAAGTVVVMADNNGSLYSTPLLTFASTNSLWGGTKNGTIWNGDAGLGNVGIGTTGPGLELQVGNSAVGSDNYNARIGLGVDGALQYISARNHSATDTGLAFWTSVGGGATATEKVRIDKNGNVGIGTTSPTYKLNVSGGPGFVARFQSASTAEKLDVYTGSNYSILQDQSGNQAGWFNGQYYISTGAGTEAMRINNGNVGIGTTNPTTALTIRKAIDSSTYGAGTRMIDFKSYYPGYDLETVKASIYAGVSSQTTLQTTRGYLAFLTTPQDSSTPTEKMRIESNGNVGIGLTNPATKLDLSGTSNYLKTYGATVTNLGAAGAVIVMADNNGSLYSVTPTTFFGTSTTNFLPLAGGIMSGAIDMGAAKNNISNVGTLTAAKITASTFDPLYTINGVNYSTFAPAISGGVREEYVGKIKLEKKNKSGEFEATINFSEVPEGSDLWLWRKVVEFNKDNIDIAITPYGGFAQVYYLINGNHLIFRSDRSAEISYRLIGRRFDWRNWPSRSEDQTTEGVEIK